jgi:hypothetical protein
MSKELINFSSVEGKVPLSPAALLPPSRTLRNLGVIVERCLTYLGILSFKRTSPVLFKVGFKFLMIHRKLIKLDFSIDPVKISHLPDVDKPSGKRRFATPEFGFYRRLNAVS